MGGSAEVDVADVLETDNEIGDILPDVTAGASRPAGGIVAGLRHDLFSRTNRPAFAVEQVSLGCTLGQDAGISSGDSDVDDQDLVSVFTTTAVITSFATTLQAQRNRQQSQLSMLDERIGARYVRFHPGARWTSLLAGLAWPMGSRRQEIPLADRNSHDLDAPGIRRQPVNDRTEFSRVWAVPSATTFDAISRAASSDIDRSPA